MAEITKKQFNVRIQNKYSSYQEWYDANPVLLAGEPSFIVVPAETGEVTQEPAVLIKVGDGTTPWQDLPYLSALSADVADWAKGAEKPEYQASEITGLSAYISGQIKDSNTKYKLEQDADDAHVLILSAMDIKEDGSDGVWKEEARITTVDTVCDLEPILKRLSDLEGLVGDEPVDSQIDIKINALDLPNTYEAKGAAAQALTDAKAYADGKDEAIAAAKKAGDDAAAAVTNLSNDLTPRVTNLENSVNTATTGLKDRVTALEDVVGDSTEGLVKDVAELQSDVSGLDSAINDPATGLSKQITDVKATADQNAADLKNKAAQSDLEALDGRVEAAEGKLTTLIGTDANKSVRAIAAEELAAKLIAADAQESLNTLEKIAAWIQEHPEDAAEMNAAILALQNQLKGIDAGEGTVKKYVDDAIAALAIGDYAKASDLTAAIDRIVVNEGDIATLKSRMEAAEGALGEDNIIEVVKVNGEALTPTDKAVDIAVPTGALANKDKVAKEDLADALATELDGKANTDDLASVAVTGNVNDLVQDEDDYIILYSGTATKLI